MTLCALRLCPSAQRVTSVKESSSRSESMTLMTVVRWLFHFRQNCCSLLAPTLDEEDPNMMTTTTREDL